LKTAFILVLYVSCVHLVIALLTYRLCGHRAKKTKAPEGAFVFLTGRWNNPEPIRRDAMQGAFWRRVLYVREPESNAAARPYGRFLHAHAAHVAHSTHTAATAHAAAG